MTISLLGLANGAAAVDSLVFALGTGDDSANRVGLAAQWDWSHTLLRGDAWRLGGYWELNANYWDAKSGRTGTASLFEFGITPVLKLQRTETIIGIVPFFEFGVGLHLQTQDKLENKDFDIPFAFGSHVGLGIRFGEATRFEFGYRYQHLSNASIGDRNPGINFHEVRLSYRY